MGSSENGRYIILIGILTPLILVLLILASLFAIFFGLFNNGTEDVPIQTVMEELQNELRTRIEEEQHDDSMDTITTIIIGSEDNTLIDSSVDVLSFFSTLYATSDGEQVAYIDDQGKIMLTKIFWEMNVIKSQIETKTHKETSTDRNGASHTETIKIHHKTIYINSLTAEEMANNYHFINNQKIVLDEVHKSSKMIISISSNMYLSKQEIEDIKNYLPLDLEINRSKIVKKALSIVGKVHYFWGGKSNALDWDSRWGTPTEVTSIGSQTTRTIRPFGLDCSGYVTWVFLNIGLDSSTIGETIGHGTTR